MTSVNKWPLSQWSPDGSPATTETALDAYEAREPLVQEVIRLIRAEDDGSDRSGGAHLFAACRLLAEWKP